MLEVHLVRRRRSRQQHNELVNVLTPWPMAHACLRQVDMRQVAEHTRWVAASVW